VGASLSRLKKHEEAFGKYQNALKLQPDLASVYVYWAASLIDLKKYDEAIEKCAKAIQIDSNSAEAYHTWGASLSGLKKHEEAFGKYQNALKLQPDLASVYVYWAASLIDLKKYDEAIEKCQKPIQLDPDFAEAYRMWGMALAGLKKHEEAIEKYQKTLELQSDSSWAYVNWATSLSKLKKYDEAIEKCQKAIHLDSNSAEAYRMWGLALAGLRKHEEAIEKYEKAADLDNKLAWIYYSWAASLDELWRYEEAIEKYRFAAAVDHDLAYAYHNAGSILWKQGRYESAHNEFEKAREAYMRCHKISQETKDVDHFLYFGSLLQSLHYPDEAEVVLARGLNLQPNNTNILVALTSLYLEEWQESRDSARYWRARNTYRRAEAILNEQLKSKQDLALFLRLGGLYLAVDELIEADKTLMDALKIDNEVSEIYNNLGVLRARQEDYAGAIRNYEAALRRAPDSLLYRSNLAEACLKAQQLDRSENEYRKVLEVAPLHLDSQIGLGECYTSMADAGDGDRYDEAITHFDVAISGASSASASKQLSKRDLASIYYSRGYAKVKKYEGSKIASKLLLLIDALKDFEKCADFDDEHQKARRAIEKLKKQLHSFPPEWVATKVGPWVIFALSFATFCAALYSLFYRKAMTEGYAALLIFGSLLFMIAGLFLPEIMKLKVAGIELEKNPADRATPSASFGIKK
jgi:tetratricopeptide (TPR) repeat protein